MTASTPPALTITRVERDWYVYEVQANGIHRVGHGTRNFVKQAVDRALLEARLPASRSVTASKGDS